MIRLMEICCDARGEPEMFAMVPEGDEEKAAFQIQRHKEDFYCEAKITFRDSGLVLVAGE